MTPSLMLVEYSFQNLLYSSLSIFLNMSRAFLTSFFLMTFNSLCCWSISRETFSGKSSESTCMGREEVWRERERKKGERERESGKEWEGEKERERERERERGGGGREVGRRDGDTPFT